jgi:hypothetical protein
MPSRTPQRSVMSFAPLALSDCHFDTSKIASPLDKRGLGGTDVRSSRPATACGVRDCEANLPDFHVPELGSASREACSH